MTASVKGTGTPDDPWTLQTPSLQGEFQMARDPEADPPAVLEFQQQAQEPSGAHQASGVGFRSRAAVPGMTVIHDTWCHV